VAIAGSNPGQSSNVTDAGHGRNGASKNHHDKSLSKKTNSTDNIIDFVTTSTNTVADPRSTEVMVRKVHLSLRYFQDAVVKGTYELLPGCATVVLETILALQSYAMSRRDPRKKSWGDEDKVSGKITASTKSMCSAVAKLTQWADRVITDGCVDPTEDYVNQVIEPVRLAVNSLASNLLAISIVPKSTSFHNSLPDLASPEREAPAGSSSRQPMSYVDQAPGPPTGSAVSRPPPLPPKSKSQSQSDDSMDPIMSSSDNANAHVDWFSNPLFDSDLARRSSSNHHHHHHHRPRNNRQSKKR
jgi:hypothetical protein